ncbi:MAG: hypothetical protein EXR85_05555 [Xanthomonadales bacterium]|nr:hypothetical protein [Xanthomonadales bacterium]
MLNRLYALLVIGLCGLTPLHAHHSPASHYLIKELATVEGVVTEFRLTNPHARIYFDVTTPEGEVQHWFAEGNSSSILKRRGWAKDSVKPGDTIKISGYPARDGGHALDWKLIELADGTQLRGGNTVGIEQDFLLEDIDKKRHVESEQPAAETNGWKLDPLSYSIGNFSTFAEMVAIGLKKMALSQALPAEEMDRLEAEVLRIAEERDVRIYREANFLVTGLFPPSATAGKDVLLIYRGDTLKEYLALKQRKADLEAAGRYGQEAQLEMAWAVGKLLSYPDKKIEQLLAK